MKKRAGRRDGTAAGRDPRLAREEGAVFKDWGGRLPVALIYPNSYYLGMSNLGVQAIYRLLNDYRGVVGERVFLENGIKAAPVSLESRRPLTDFAVLAFSLSYELDYFNIVPALRAAGIPPRAADRDERHPLIIAGGPCVTANPAPLARFCDAFCIGEAEPVFPDLVPVLIEGSGGARRQLLENLAGVPGLYVPSVPPATPVARRWASDLDAFATTTTILTPDTELGDLYLIEVERGCNRGCRFCLVSTCFAPMRYRSPEYLLEQARHGLQYRKRIGLVGPALSDYPRLDRLLEGLEGMGAGFSLSSLRINRLSADIIGSLARGRARTVTLAPEAGTERLRRLINKGISDDDILAAAAAIAAQPVPQVKLYFMLGLPTETDDDVRGIVKTTLEIKEVLDRGRGQTRITLNVAPFVPKAGTPFQWLPMATPDALSRRLGLLKDSLNPKGIRVKAGSPAWSQVQGVLARGGPEVAGVLETIGPVTLPGWRQAAAGCGLDTEYYTREAWGAEKELPWSIIDQGNRKRKLRDEMEQALLLQ